MPPTPCRGCGRFYPSQNGCRCRRSPPVVSSKPQAASDATSSSECSPSTPTTAEASPQTRRTGGRLGEAVRALDEHFASAVSKPSAELTRQAWAWEERRLDGSTGGVEASAADIASLSATVDAAVAAASAAKMRRQIEEEAARAAEALRLAEEERRAELEAARAAAKRREMEVHHGPLLFPTHAPPPHPHLIHQHLPRHPQEAEACRLAEEASRVKCEYCSRLINPNRIDAHLRACVKRALPGFRAQVAALDEATVRHEVLKAALGRAHVAEQRNTELGVAAEAAARRADTSEAAAKSMEAAFDAATEEAREGKQREAALASELEEVKAKAEAAS